MLPWDIVTSRRVLTLYYSGILKTHMGVNYMLPWDIVISRRVLTLCYHGILKPHTKGQHHDVC